MVLERQRPQRLKSAILRGKIQDTGKFKTYKKEIDLNADSKRFWPERLTTVHSDLCVSSMPLEINLDGRLYAKESRLSFYAKRITIPVIMNSLTTKCVLSIPHGG